MCFRIIFVLTLMLPGFATAQHWEPVTGEDTLRQLFSDTVFETKLEDNVDAIANYNADGSGELRAWGDVFPREWKIEDDTVCIRIDGLFRCFRIERTSGEPAEYRATQDGTGESVVFTVSPQRVLIGERLETDTGGAVQPSAEEMAAKLSNPTSPVMTIGKVGLDRKSTRLNSSH